MAGGGGPRQVGLGNHPAEVAEVAVDARRGRRERVGTAARLGARQRVDDGVDRLAVRVQVLAVRHQVGVLADLVQPENK